MPPSTGAPTATGPPPGPLRRVPTRPVAPAGRLSARPSERSPPPRPALTRPAPRPSFSSRPLPPGERSIVKRRVLVDRDGTMWRTQAARRHKRYKKSSGRLSALRGLAPLAPAIAAKLRKLGYKRRWWYAQKA